jgi:hypothetical protein
MSPVYRLVCGGVAAGFVAFFVSLALKAPEPLPPWPAVLLIILMGSVFGLLPFALAGHARVEVDARTRELVLTRVQWLRRSRALSIPLARVTDAVVRIDDDPNADAIRHMVFLVVEGEPLVPLVEGLWVPDESRCERAAAEIRALLGK